MRRERHKRPARAAGPAAAIPDVVDVDLATVACFVDALNEASLRMVVKNLLDSNTDSNTAQVVASRVALALEIQCSSIDSYLPQHWDSQGLPADADASNGTATPQNSASSKQRRGSTPATPPPAETQSPATPLPDSAVCCGAGDRRDSVASVTHRATIDPKTKKPAFMSPLDKETRERRRGRGSTAQKAAATQLQARHRGNIARRIRAEQL